MSGPPNNNSGSASDESGEPVTLQTLLNQMTSNHNQTTQGISKLTTEVNTLSLNLKSTTEKVEKIDKELTQITNTQASHTASINSFGVTQDNLGHRVAILEGIVHKQEQKIRELEDKHVYSVARSMQNNILFCNIKEESSENTRQVVIDFMKDEMKIPDEQIGIVGIRRVHRVGSKEAATKKPRRIVACVERPDIIFQHRKNLNFDEFQVAQQYPAEINETRRELKTVMRNDFASVENKRLVVDELYIEGNRYQPRFMSSKCAPQQYDADKVNFQQDVPKITITGEHVEKGNCFIGYTATVNSLESARLVLDALGALQSKNPPTHLAFGYVLSSQSGIEYQYDDGEAGAGSTIRAVLKTSNTRSQLVAVARWHSGIKLGQKRLRELYTQTSQRALKKVFGEQWKPVAETGGDWS